MSASRGPILNHDFLPTIETLMPGSEVNEITLL